MILKELTGKHGNYGALSFTLLALMLAGITAYAAPKGALESNNNGEKVPVAVTGTGDKPRIYMTTDISPAEALGLGSQEYELVKLNG